MAIFYHQVVFWVSRSGAEWLSIMFVRGDFIEEHWGRIGCRAQTHTHTHTADVCVERGCVWRLVLRLEVEWSYWICGHLGFYVANKPRTRSNSSDCLKKKMKTIKVQVLHSGARRSRQTLQIVFSPSRAAYSYFFPTMQQRNEKAFTRLFTSKYRYYIICCRLVCTDSFRKHNVLIQHLISVQVL